MLARLGGLRQGATVVATAIVVGYVSFIGGQPPALRAALLAIVTAIEQHRQRCPRSGPLFATVAFAVLILDPWAVTDLGAWLSVTALWGATAAVRWSDRALGDGHWWRLVAGSTGATIATAPVTTAIFGAVPLAGVALNLVAIPLTALAVPAAAVSLIVDPVSQGLAGIFAAGGGTLLALLEWIATRGAAVPGVAVTFGPGLGPGLVVAGLVAGVVWACGSRQTAREASRRLLWGGAVAVTLHGLVFWLPRGDRGSRVTLHFLDVGQGDAALVETPRGEWVLIDAGPADERSDAGRRVIVPYLRRHGVRRLAAIVISHGHRDHLGGLVSVAAAVPVDRVLEPGVEIRDREYLATLDSLLDRGVPWLPLRAGARFAIDGVEFEVLHPSRGWAGFGEDLNEDSAVLRLRAGPFAAIFPGDAGFPVEQLIAGEVGRVNLLKVGHHGSRTATGSPWLDRIAPQLAVVSVGRNRYGHPSPEALERMAAAGTDLWRTDRDGTVVVTVGATFVEVGGGRRRVRYPLDRERRTKHGDSRRSGRHDRAIHPRSGAALPRGDRRAIEPSL
jgi:competence protein ComEC